MNQADAIYKAIKERAVKFTDCHDVHTPRELVDEILVQIPLTGKILVLFNVEFVTSLVYDFNVDPKNIVFYSDSVFKSKMMKRVGAFIITTLDTNMKFDVIVGNPPFQDGNRDDEANKVWPKFVKRAYELLADGGTVALITPTGWMQPTADIGKGTGKNSFSIFKDIFLKENLILANIDSDTIRNTYFKGVGSTFSYYIFQKGKYSGNTTFITSTGTISVDIRSIVSLPKLTSKESLSVVKKMLGTPFAFKDQNHNLNGVESVTQSYTAQYKVYHTNKNGGTYWFGEKKNPYSSSPKVIISLSGTYKPVLNNTDGFSNMCIALVCNSESEAEVARDVLASKLYRFWVEMQKFSGFNPRKLLLSLPAVNLTRVWSDADLYAHFGLTQEEIDYVEANTK